MGIALLSLVDLFTPLQSLASRWIPVRRSRRNRSSGLRYVGIRPSCAPRPDAAAQAPVPARARPLRVVRMVDAREPGQHAGRVMISGRMEDVCAELDRLAALEATGAVRPSHLH
ncbi:MAG: hypothetical protein EOP82_30135 [Variovorax sp.]|nr:MAG: hypothetical protein EOP82_30135 [Variovorax sp.]